MWAKSQPAARFVRRTRLEGDEYRKNFRQLDIETIEAVTSGEADAVTPLMSKVYLRLANAPEGFWEREGVLRFTGEERDGRWATAWAQLVTLTGVSSATARKALSWMHEVGVVGYYAGKNGVGIRIFLNRAASSIGRRPSAGQKNLRLVRASNGELRTSTGDTPFKDSFAVLEVLEKDLNPDAPASGAEEGLVPNPSPEPPALLTSATPAACATARSESGGRMSPAASPQTIRVEDIYYRLKAELEPRVTEVAALSAARAAQREMEAARVWFESKALPKAVRVAQRETYDLARKLAREGEGVRQARVDSEVGRRSEPVTGGAARRLTDGEVRETAEVCVALLEAQGRAVEATLGEIGAEGGGWVPAEDVARVRAEVENVLREVKGDGSLDDGR